MDNSVWSKIKQSLFQAKQQKNSESKPSSETKLSFFHWMVIVVCVGMAAMILHNYFTMKEDIQPMGTPEVLDQQDESKEVFGGSSARESPTDLMQKYEQMYENQLIEILSHIIGVGDVSVMITLESTPGVVVEKNINTQTSNINETDREGGKRVTEEHRKDESVVILRKDNGEEVVVRMTKQPRVRGVMIVASGANNMQVKAWITEAVQRVLDVPAHKVSVLPKKS